MKSFKGKLVFLAIAIALPSCNPISKEATKEAGERLGDKLVETFPQKQSYSNIETWQVIKIADGDTITVTQGNRKEKIRFCGVDSPESKQPLGQESKVNLRRLIDEANGQVQLSFIERDRYGRQVAEVFAGGKFLNEEQVKAGLSYHYARYSSNCPNRSAIVSAEEIAKSNHSGVWGGSYEKPWDYRKARR